MGDVVSSYKYYCSGDDAKYAVYLSGDCTGDATEVDVTGYDVVCDADPCDYATIRVESGTTDSCDSDAYITYAYVISECYEAVAGFSYASASCDDTGIVLDLYAADMTTARATPPRRRRFSARTRRAPPSAAAEAEAETEARPRLPRPSWRLSP